MRLYGSDVTDRASVCLHAQVCLTQGFYQHFSMYTSRHDPRRSMRAERYDVGVEICLEFLSSLLYISLKCTGINVHSLTLFRWSFLII